MFPFGENAISLADNKTVAVFVFNSKSSSEIITPMFPAKSVPDNWNLYFPSGARLPDEAKPFHDIDSGGNSPKLYSFTTEESFVFMIFPFHEGTVA